MRVRARGQSHAGDLSSGPSPAAAGLIASSERGGVECSNSSGCRPTSPLAGELYALVWEPESVARVGACAGEALRGALADAAAGKLLGATALGAVMAAAALPLAAVTALGAALDAPW